jgi:hypothetical protein
MPSYFNLFLRGFKRKYLKKNSIHEHAMMHIPRPLSCMEKRKIKIILLKRDFEEM